MAKKEFTLEQALDNLSILAEMTSDGSSGQYVTTPFSPIPEISLMLGGKSTRQKFLLTGQDGCGKTTELNRLAEMEKERYFIVRCHHEHLSDMREADITDFLLVLLRALADAVETISPSLNRRIASSLLDIFKPGQGIELDAVFPILGIGFSFESTSKKSLRDMRGDAKEQTRVRKELREFRSEVVSMVHKAIEEIREDRKKPILILVDDLEKINYQDVYRLITENTQILSSLPFAAVYTVPLGILFSDKHSLLRSEFHVLDMANIPGMYREAEGKNIEFSFTFLSKIAESRAGQFWTGLEPRWAKPVMVLSGGHLRQFLSLLRYMLLEMIDSDISRIDPQHIRRAAIKINSGLRRLVREEDIEILEEYQTSRDHIDVKHHRLLYNYLILDYWHPDIGHWYLSNPLAIRSTIETLLKST